MAQRLVVVWRSSDLMCNNSLLTLLARAITLEAWALAGLSGHLSAACTRGSKITRALARTKELNTIAGTGSKDRMTATLQPFTVISYSLHEQRRAQKKAAGNQSKGQLCYVKPAHCARGVLLP